MKAIDVLKAAKKTFSLYGDEDYTERKANNFVYRCGARVENGPEQTLDMEIIKQVVYSMLDADSEEVFWGFLWGQK